MRLLDGSNCWTLNIFEILKLGIFTIVIFVKVCTVAKFPNLKIVKLLDLTFLIFNFKYFVTFKVIKICIFATSILSVSYESAKLYNFKIYKIFRFENMKFFETRILTRFCFFKLAILLRFLEQLKIKFYQDFKSWSGFYNNYFAIFWKC